MAAAPTSASVTACLGAVQLQPAFPRRLRPGSSSSVATCLCLYRFPTRITYSLIRTSWTSIATLHQQESNLDAPGRTPQDVGPSRLGACSSSTDPPFTQSVAPHALSEVGAGQVSGTASSRLLQLAAGILNYQTVTMTPLAESLSAMSLRHPDGGRLIGCPNASSKRFLSNLPHPESNLRDGSCSTASDQFRRRWGQRQSGIVDEHWRRT